MMRPVEPQAWLTPDPAEVEFYADDPVWKTFTVHTNLDSVLVQSQPVRLRPGPRGCRRRNSRTHQRLIVQPKETIDPQGHAEMAGACM